MGYSSKDYQATYKLKDFTHSDWYGLAGAESPSEDQPPMICRDLTVTDLNEKENEGNHVEVVVDANGLFISGLDNWWEHKCIFPIGKIIANWLLSAKEVERSVFDDLRFHHEQYGQ